MSQARRDSWTVQHNPFILCCRFHWVIRCENRTFRKLTMRQVHFHSLQSRPSNHGDSRNPHGYKTTQNSTEGYKHKKDRDCYLLLLFHAFGKLSGGHQHPLNQPYWHQLATVRVPVCSLTSTALPYFLFSLSLLKLFALVLWALTSGSLLPLEIETSLWGFRICSDSQIRQHVILGFFSLNWNTVVSDR